MKPTTNNDTQASNDWETILKTICDDGDLVKCLSSPSVCGELIQSIHGELGVPKIYIQLVFRLVLIPGIFVVGKAVGSFVALEKVVPRLLKIPFAATVMSWLGSSLQSKVEELRRQRRLDDLLEGRRTAAEILTDNDPDPNFQLTCRALQEIQELGDSLHGLLHLQPLLMIPVEPTAHRYHFRRRQVPLLGRVDELRRLEDFVFSQEAHSLSQREQFVFQWWLLTGPGGAGKSRLALEFCLNLGLTQARCGFLNSRQLKAFKWEDWQPECLTVLVIDYVAGAADDVLELVRILNNRKSTRPLENPVRLLLLEREARGTWWERFEASIDVRASSYQRRDDGGPAYHSLTSLGDDLHWGIMAELHRQAQKPLPDQAETLATLARIDDKRRPLFTVFAAIALVQGQNIRDWNQENLLHYLLDDEKKVWKRIAEELKVDAKTLEAHHNLLALLTLCGGLYQEQLMPVLEKNLPFLPSLEEGDRSLLREELMEAFSGVTRRDGFVFYEPLQPDLFGEYLLLQDFLEKDDLVAQKRTDKLINEAWLADPLFTGLVMMRLFNDFPQHPGKERLYAKAPDSTDITVLGLWTGWAMDLVSWYGSDQKFEQATATYQKVRKLIALNPDAGLQINQAKAAFNLTTDFGTAGRLDEARTFYQAIVDLAADHPHQEIFIIQANAAYNLTTDFGTAGRLDEAETFFSETQTLLERVDSPVVTILLARMALVLTWLFIEKQDLDRANGYLGVCLNLTKAGLPVEACREHVAFILQTLNDRFGEMEWFQNYLSDLGGEAPDEA